MRRNDQFTCRLEVTEIQERGVIARYGLPSRPVYIPLSTVDLSPVGEGGRFYTATMSAAAAKEYGLTL